MLMLYLAIKPGPGPEGADGSTELWRIPPRLIVLEPDAAEGDDRTIPS